MWRISPTKISVTFTTGKHYSATSGLVTEYNVRESPIRRYFNLIGCLPFVPAQYVQEIGSYIQPQLPSDLHDFADYCQRTWIGTPHHTPPRFAHELWNQHSNVLELLPRSSNIIEGWHQGFASMMGCTQYTPYHLEISRHNEKKSRLLLMLKSKNGDITSHQSHGD